MTWLLHLSDPHLGAVSQGQELDDLKVQVVQEDIETTQRVFRRTLASLREYVETLGPPAAAVVTGDITYASRRDGFDAFVALLDEHGDLLPDREQIVVVPGNHDVVWDAEPGTEERYEEFLRGTRRHGCATPLLDGVDFNTVTPTRLRDGASDDPHVVDHEDFLLIPLNSSNWCGALIDIPNGWDGETWAEKLEALGEERDEALKQLKRLRQQDMPRVSQAQIDALRELFHVKGIAVDRGADPRPRIAMLHHQLLPVSTRVELKPFESLVNLGLVRQTLRDFGVDIILHGHKHESGIYWDFARRAGDRPMLERRTLVVAAPGHFRPHQPVMRGLELRGLARARNVYIQDFNGVDGATTRPELGQDLTLPLWLGQMEFESSERTTIRGRTTHQTYARLCSQFGLVGSPTLTNVVCEIDDASDASQLPPDYPETGSSDGQQWFSDLVSWWQLPSSRLVREGILSFNHGERIRSRWGNQVKRAARLLNEREESSRGLVVLIDPGETGRREGDTRPLNDGTYPAFVLAEFVLTKRNHRRELDCFAYFRKQEMRYWWPVNVAELRLLQQEVADGLDDDHRAHLGRLVTFSAIALSGEKVPRVAVTQLDRLIESEESVWRLAAAVAFPASPGAAEALDDWTRALDELSGEGRAAPPVPARGHEVLLEELRRFERLAPDSGASAVADALEKLCKIYRALPPLPHDEAQRAVIVPGVESLREALGTASNNQ